MGTYLGNPDGTVTDRQIKAYAQAADGGAGLIFMDNAVPVPMVSCGLRADKDEFIAGLTLLAETVKNMGPFPAFSWLIRAEMLLLSAAQMSLVHLKSLLSHGMKWAIRCQEP